MAQTLTAEDLTAIAGIGTTGGEAGTLAGDVYIARTAAAASALSIADEETGLEAIAVAAAIAAAARPVVVPGRTEATGKITPVPFSDSKDLAAAVSGYRHRVLGLVVVGGAAGGTFSLTSGTGGTISTIYPSTALAANGTLVLPSTGIGYFETVTGEKLAIAVAAGAVSGVAIVQTIRAS